jgi:transcriptional regulator with XRE-family HTH domain
MSRIGSEICRLRKEAGMTQKQLAKQLGVTEKFIVEVENGKKVINSELISRVSKVLSQESGKFELYDEAEISRRPEPDPTVKRVIEKPVKEIWTDALAGVLMSVPVYKYSMDKAVDSKKLPIIANKVEGCPKDKVFYLIVEDNEMSGFRLLRGDMVLACEVPEFEKDALYFIEVGGRRYIRQVKRLDQDKLLIIGNSGSLDTKTISKKELKIMAKLIRLEVAL